MQRQNHERVGLINQMERGCRRILTAMAIASSVAGFGLFDKIGKFARKGRIRFKDYYEPKVRQIDRMIKRRSLDAWAASQNYAGWAGHPNSPQ